VAIPLPAPSGRAVVAFDAAQAPVERARVDAIVAALPQLLWIAHAVHEWRRGLAGAEATTLRAPTAQERRCLAMSASGLTSRAIGSQLGIAPRTVDFHVRNVAVKLGAANRHEAIAKAATRGWI
jgi:DNA-binding CsgD family transcriptional regulator